MAKLKNSQNFVDILSDVIRRKEISQENKRSAQWLRHQIRNFRRNLNVTFDDTSMTSEQLMEKTKLIKPGAIDEAKLTLFQFICKQISFLFKEFFILVLEMFRGFLLCLMKFKVNM